MFSVLSDDVTQFSKTFVLVNPTSNNMYENFVILHSHQHLVLAAFLLLSIPEV